MSKEIYTPGSSNAEEKQIPMLDSSFNDEKLSHSFRSIEKPRMPSSTKEKQQFTPIQAINEYYRLKDKYETVYYEKYIKPILKSNKSNKEKRVDYSRLPKHECVNCKRNVGTIFNISLNKDYVRQFTGKCGDLVDPCPLDIQIDHAYREQYDKAFNNDIKIIENIKLNIIKAKNNALFFNEKVVDKFEKLTEKLKRETGNAGFLIESNILKNNNPEKQVLLNNTIDEFGKGCIIPFKQMVQNYMETDNEIKLKQAVDFYVNEMTPKLKDIASLKYNVNYVEYDEYYKPSGSVNSAYKLIQLPNSLENTEFCIESDDKVLKFVTGVKKSKKTKTMKLGEISKKKTRKIKPNFELVIEGEEEEEREGEIPKLINKDGSEDLEGVPDFDAPGGVRWDNEKYNEMWSNMEVELKNILITDHEWLQEFMTRCVASRNSKNPCKLFLPKQTIVPPNKLEDGTYDLGVEVLNHVFNKLDKVYQKTLLTWCEEKYAKNNYESFKNVLVTVLGRSLNLNKFRYEYV